MTLYLVLGNEWQAASRAAGANAKADAHREKMTEPAPVLPRRQALAYAAIFRRMSQRPSAAASFVRMQKTGNAQALSPAWADPQLHGMVTAVIHESDRAAIER